MGDDCNCVDILGRTTGNHCPECQLESLKEDCEKIYQQNDILSQQIETLEEANRRLKNACNWLIGNQILNVDKYFTDNLRVRTEKQFKIDLTEVER